MSKVKGAISYIILFIMITSVSCKTEDGTQQVKFDSSFNGARLDSLVKTDNKSYTAFIKPAFEPVNKSPWYAFTISSESEQEIVLTLDYDKYKHRYIPKLSYDKQAWQPIEKSKIKVDTITGKALLKLKVAPRKLYVAAQELESSADTYKWVDSLLKVNPYLEKSIAGETTLKKKNYVLTSNNSQKKAIILIARQHPPEIPGGTIGFKAFYETLLGETKTAKTFREEYNIITFPLLNPDGADMGNWRHNANGKDLNRDWKDFTQPETQLVKSYVESKIKQGAEIRFAIDFHTSYSGPYLLVLDSINELKTDKIIPKWIDGIERNSPFKVEARRRSQELPYCYNYFFNEIGCEAVTYEDGDEIDRNIIRNRAKIYAIELMNTLNAKTK